MLKAYHGSSVDVEIPDGVQKIGSGAFRGMAIESVHIPASCETFAMNAFHDCRSLRRFSVDVANPSFAADSQGCLWSKDFSVLLKPFNQVAFLKPHAEKGLYGTCISANSRACCMRIDEDNFLSSEGTTMMGMDGDIRVPIDKNGIRTIIFPRGMKTIDSNFSGFRDLETVCFPSTLEQVGENALCDCPRCAAKLRVTATKKVGLLKKVPVVWECDQCGLFMTEGALESPEALIRLGGIAPNFMMFL